jgi:hypothetical protein
VGGPSPGADGSGCAGRSVSSTGPQAAARWGWTDAVGSGRAAAGPGEDRYLTRVAPQYAPGSAGQGLGPQGRYLAGLPRGERGVWGAAPRFTGHREAHVDGPQVQPAGPSDGFTVAQSSGFAKRRASVAMAGGLGACPQGFQAGQAPLLLDTRK